MQKIGAIALIAGLGVVSGLAGAYAPRILNAPPSTPVEVDPAFAAKRAAEAAARAEAAALAEAARLEARAETQAELIAARKEMDEGQDYLTRSRNATAAAAALGRARALTPETFDYVLARSAIVAWDGFDRATRDRLLELLESAKEQPAQHADALAEILAAFGA
ncbi:hypothetical protein [Phaeovulum sp.]|uniref:hypothetical protein n=1 Tax=Phaeovulum sp. TaxID=2934796 RepID=UPI0035621F1D